MHIYEYVYIYDIHTHTYIWYIHIYYYIYGIHIHIHIYDIYSIGYTILYVTCIYIYIYIFSSDKHPRSSLTRGSWAWLDHCDPTIRFLFKGVVVDPIWDEKVGIYFVSEDNKCVHPLEQTWNLKMDPWKRRFLLETIISRFHVCFRGCIYNYLSSQNCNSSKKRNPSMIFANTKNIHLHIHMRIQLHLHLPIHVYIYAYVYT